MMDEARARTAYLPLRSEEDVRKLMPSMQGYARVPNLIRIAAARPKTMEAEMKAWNALKKERTIDPKLIAEVFWVVSKSNGCGHCMGHIAFSVELSGAPLSKALDIDSEANLDPRRRATFAFARKVARDSHSVTPTDVASLRPYFKDDQIVELILTICRYDTMNTLAEAFGSPLETINVFDPKNAEKKPEPKEAQSESPKETGEKVIEEKADPKAATEPKAPPEPKPAAEPKEDGKPTPAEVPSKSDAPAEPEKPAAAPVPETAPAPAR